MVKTAAIRKFYSSLELSLYEIQGKARRLLTKSEERSDRLTQAMARDTSWLDWYYLASLLKVHKYIDLKSIYFYFESWVNDPVESHHQIWISLPYEHIPLYNLMSVERTQNNSRPNAALVPYQPTAVAEEEIPNLLNTNLSPNPSPSTKVCRATYSYNRFRFLALIMLL